MSKNRRQCKLTSTVWGGLMFLSGMLATLVILKCFPSIISPSILPPLMTMSTKAKANVVNTTTMTTFYDDPYFNYQMETPIRDWDEKRDEWMTTHPSFSRSIERVVMVTGSQPKPCTNPNGDHMLLRLFKNKVDYCRIHGHDIFYNNLLLHPGMYTYWAKYPLVKAAMLAHPEAEWVWWMDSDAVFTDMDFNLPLEKYNAHNLVIYGWPGVLYEKKSSMGINAGVFLIRNCQWSMDLLDRWASFGPQTKDFARWGKVQQSMFFDKTDTMSDDQTALSYMLLMEKDQWGDKVHIETEYYFQGYFMDIVGKFENVTRQYKDIERRVPVLRRRHAEKAGEGYRALWKKYLDGVNTGGYQIGSWRRPFVTHFTGCEPCSGAPNPMYSEVSCRGGMVRALNFADSQVLRNFGYTRRDLSNSSSVQPL